MEEESGKQDHFHTGFSADAYYPTAYMAYYPYDERQFEAQQPVPFTPPQPATPSQQQATQGMPPQLPPEQSYIENILRLNQGKLVRVHMNFEEGTQPEQIFEGEIEAAGRDHIILSDPETGMRYLLLMVYLDYVVFTEEINYNPAFGTAPNTLMNTAR